MSRYSSSKKSGNSFLTSLLKVFIRSAVSQVGRDGGKVISNRVYRDRHSTPVRMVSSQTSNLPNIDNKELSADDYENVNQVNLLLSKSDYSRTDLLRNGFQRHLFKDMGLFGIILFAPLGAFVIPYLGPIGMFLYSFLFFFKKASDFYLIDVEPVFVEDNRYKSGVRQAGFQEVKKYHNKQFPLTTGERLLFVFFGIYWLSLSGVIFYLHYTFFKSL